MIKNIDTMPILDRSVGLNYSNTMSSEEKINYLVQNLRLVLSNQKRLDIMTGDPKLDYKPFPFTKKDYDMQQDDFKGEGKAIVDILRRLNWEKEDIRIEKYDISSLSELIPEKQNKLIESLKQNTHSIAIVTIADKKYIVDCAYRQFFSTKDSMDTVSSDTMNIEEIMLKTEQSTQVATQMLKYGFIEATQENLKTYMDGFIIAIAKDENIELPTAQEYGKRVKGQALNIGRVQNEYYLKELWKPYIEKLFPDNSEETLNFKNNKIFSNIRSKLYYSEDSFQIVMIDDKKYIRNKDGDIEFSLDNLKAYLDSILIEMAKDKSGKSPDIVTPSIEEYLKLYPCAELPKEYSNYIIESEPFIISEEKHSEEFNEKMSDEEKLTSVVQKERKYLMKKFNLVHESLEGECEDSSVRVILDCTSKGFEDAMFLSPNRYIEGEGHNCTIASLNGKSYLIDCTYRQFFTKSQIYSKAGEEHHHCGMYMIADKNRKKVAEQILKYGWIEATPENLKAYMDGYEMAKRKSFVESGISAEEYLKMLAEDEIYPIHIVTNRQIDESVSMDPLKKAIIGNLGISIGDSKKVIQTKSKVETVLNTSLEGIYSNRKIRRGQIQKAIENIRTSNRNKINTQIYNKGEKYDQ